jgi:hypothetical protein
MYHWGVVVAREDVGKDDAAVDGGGVGWVGGASTVDYHGAGGGGGAGVFVGDDVVGDRLGGDLRLDAEVFFDRADALHEVIDLLAVALDIRDARSQIFDSATEVANLLAQVSEVLRRFLAKRPQLRFRRQFFQVVFGRHAGADVGDVFGDGGEAAFDGFRQLGECFLRRMVHTREVYHGAYRLRRGQLLGRG